jgi:hypothetical protein
VAEWRTPLDNKDATGGVLTTTCVVGLRLWRFVRSGLDSTQKSPQLVANTNRIALPGETTNS